MQNGVTHGMANFLQVPIGVKLDSLKRKSSELLTVPCPAESQYRKNCLIKSQPSPSWAGLHDLSNEKSTEIDNKNAIGVLQIRRCIELKTNKEIASEYRHRDHL